MISSIKTLAIQLMVGVAFAACSSSDDSIIEQPVNPTAPKTYTMTIRASKGDDATTRGLHFADDSKKNLKVNWNGKEKVRVVQDGQVIGTLLAAMSSDESTTLTGTVTGFQNNHDVGFYLLADENGKMDYTGQKGAVLEENGPGNNIEENYDFASYELTGSECVEAFTTDGSNIVPKDGIYIPFYSQQAIVRFELQKSDGSDLWATQFIVTDKNTGKLVKSIDAKNGAKTYGRIVLIPGGNSTAYTYYVALNLDDNTSDLRLFALDSDGNLYTYEKSSVTFEKGKYYRVTVKMHLCTKFPLSQITAEDTQFKGWYIGGTIADGDTENCAYKLFSSGVNAVIAYVGKVPGYFDNFLAISKHDSKNDGTEGRDGTTNNWRTYANVNSVGKYAGNHPIKIGSTTYNTNSFDNYNGNVYQPCDWVANSIETASNTYNGATLKGWRMPTITDWRYIFYGLCGTPSPTDPAGVADKVELGTNDPLTILNAEPGYNLDLYGGNYYCTSSGIDVNGGNYWYIFFSSRSNIAYFSHDDNFSTVCYLRPVFAY